MIPLTELKQLVECVTRLLESPTLPLNDEGREQLTRGRDELAAVVKQMEEDEKREERRAKELKEFWDAELNAVKQLPSWPKPGEP